MKKISVVALLSILACPVFAEDSDSVVSADVKVVAEEAVAAASESVQVTVEDAKNNVADAVKDSLTDASDAADDFADTMVEKSAASFPNGLQIGVGVSGTSGLNAFIGYANKEFDSFWAKRFGVRFDFATTKPIRSSVNKLLDSVIGDGVDIGDNITITDAKLDAHHYAAMLDFYPFGNTWFLGGWRLTGGYYIGEMHADALLAGTIDGLASGYQEFELMDTQFRYLGNTVNGTAALDWKYRGPYVGTGFDFGLLAGLKIYLDAGVVFTNRAATLDLDVPFDNLEINCGSGWENVVDNNLQSVVDSVVADALSDAQSELDDFKFYPMVKVGFMYRF